MKKYFLLVSILPLLFTSCNLTRKVQESTHAIEVNKQAVEASTQSIEANGQAISHATNLILKNAEAVDKSTQLIERMNSFTEGLHLDTSMLIPIGVLLLLLLLLPSLIALTMARKS